MDASLSCGSRVFGGVGMPPRRVDRVVRVNQAYQGNGQALSQRGGEGGWEDGRMGGLESMEGGRGRSATTCSFLRRTEDLLGR